MPRIKNIPTKREFHRFEIPNHVANLDNCEDYITEDFDDESAESIEDAVQLLGSNSNSNSNSNYENSISDNYQNDPTSYIEDCYEISLMDYLDFKISDDYILIGIQYIPTISVAKMLMIDYKLVAISDTDYSMEFELDNITFRSLKTSLRQKKAIFSILKYSSGTYLLIFLSSRTKDLFTTGISLDVLRWSLCTAYPTYLLGTKAFNLIEFLQLIVKHSQFSCVSEDEIDSTRYLLQNLGLLPHLRPYQLQGILWMLKRETILEEIIDCQIQLDNNYYNFIESDASVNVSRALINGYIPIPNKLVVTEGNWISSSTTKAQKNITQNKDTIDHTEFYQQLSSHMLNKQENLINYQSDSLWWYNLMTGHIVDSPIIQTPVVKGGFLIDEMGLGKTCQVIGLLLLSKSLQSTDKFGDTRNEAAVTRGAALSTEIKNEPMDDDTTTITAINNEIYPVALTEANGIPNAKYDALQHFLDTHTEDKLIQNNPRNHDERVNANHVDIIRDNIPVEEAVENNDVEEEAEWNGEVIEVPNTTYSPHSKKRKLLHEEFIGSIKSSSNNYQNDINYTTDSEGTESDQNSDCFCGRTLSKKFEADWIQCDHCKRWAHLVCAGLTDHQSAAALDNYECRSCLCCRLLLQPIPSTATLVVVPNPILQQWESELAKHLKPGSLAIYVYRGIGEVSRLASSDPGRVAELNPTILAKLDLVVTSFEVLGAELAATESPYAGSVGGLGTGSNHSRKFFDKVDVHAARELRRRKRYIVIPSALACVQWHRLILDEAQMIQGAAAAATQMALRLSSVIKWGVTGTPLGSGKLADLSSLMKFIGQQPFSTLDTWRKLIGDGSSEHSRSILFSFCSKLMLRRTKISVASELGIPPQTESVSFLRFTTVEAHFYRQLHDEITLLLRKASDSKSRGKKSEEKRMDDLFSKLLSLRQACCHPQLGSKGVRGGGGRVLGTSKSNHNTIMSMDAILSRLVDGVRTKCEEAQRLQLMSLCGAAGVARIQSRQPWTADDSEDFPNHLASSDIIRNTYKRVHYLCKALKSYEDAIKIFQSNRRECNVVGGVTLKGRESLISEIDCLADDIPLIWMMTMKVIEGGGVSDDNNNMGKQKGHKDGIIPENLISTEKIIKIESNKNKRYSSKSKRRIVIDDNDEETDDYSNDNNSNIVPEPCLSTVVEINKNIIHNDKRPSYLFRISATDSITATGWMQVNLKRSPAESSNTSTATSSDANPAITYISASEIDCNGVTAQLNLSSVRRITGSSVMSEAMTSIQSRRLGRHPLLAGDVILFPRTVKLQVGAGLSGAGGGIFTDISSVIIPFPTLNIDETCAEMATDEDVLVDKIWQPLKLIEENDDLIPHRLNEDGNSTSSDHFGMRSRMWRVTVETFYAVGFLLVDTRTQDDMKSSEIPKLIERKRYVCSLHFQLREAEFDVDPLQEFHIAHNTAKVVQELTVAMSECSNSSISDNCDNYEFQSEEEVSNKSLLYDKMSSRALALHSQYLRAAREIRESAKLRMTDIVENINNNKTGNEKGLWWTALLKSLNQYQRAEAVSQLGRTLLRDIENVVLHSELAYRAAVPTIPRDTSGLLVLLVTLTNKLESARSSALKGLLKLPDQPSSAEVEECGNCRKCRSYLNRSGPICRHCKLEDLLKDYEDCLFSYRRQNKAKRKKVEAVNDDDKMEMDIEQNSEFNDVSREAFQMDGPAIQITAIINRFLSIHKDTLQYLLPTLDVDWALEIAQQESERYSQMQKELLPMRGFWRQHFQLLSAWDELAMAAEPLRSVKATTKLAESELASVVVEGEEQSRYQHYELENSASEAELEIKLGQLRYLKNIDNQRRDENDAAVACSICMESLSDGNEICVIGCGHSFHKVCIDYVCKKSTATKTIKCPICRQVTLRSAFLTVANESTILNKVANATPTTVVDDVTINHSVVVEGQWGSKIRALLRDLMLLPRDHKAVIFSQWSQMLDIVTAAFIRNGIRFERFEGGRKCGAALVRFRSDAGVKALLVPIKSGAQGLTLVEASHVFLLEPLLNAEQEAQAVNRIHRIGQTKASVVHRYIVRDTVEEKIYEKLLTKTQNDSIENSSDSLYV